MNTTKETTAPVAERRRSSRRQPTQGTTCQLEVGSGEKLIWGLVWNISASGISVLVGSAVEPGTQLRGALLAADGVTSLDLSLKVAHLRKLHTGDYFLGGHFQRPLTPEELRPFIGEIGYQTANSQ
jgi:hypothetical protein